jgi:hypothetical protein
VIYLTKEVEELCNENYKTSKKENRKTLENEKISHVQGSTELTL